MDLVVTSANVRASNNGGASIVFSGTAGAAIAAGDVIYRDATDNVMKLSDANAAAPANTVSGIALNSAATGQPVAYATLDPDFTPGAAVTAGEVYVLSATPGKIAPVTDLASGYTAIVIGVGKAGNKLNFQPLAGGAVA